MGSRFFPIRQRDEEHNQSGLEQNGLDLEPKWRGNLRSSFGPLHTIPRGRPRIRHVPPECRQSDAKGIPDVRSEIARLSNVHPDANTFPESLTSTICSAHRCCCCLASPVARTVVIASKVVVGLQSVQPSSMCLDVASLPFTMGGVDFSGRTHPAWRDTKQKKSSKLVERTQKNQQCVVDCVLTLANRNRTPLLQFLL